jgi:hypothetical protein
VLPVSDRLPPTPEDVAIVRQQLRRVMGWHASDRYAMPAWLFLQVLARARDDYVEPPRHYGLYSAYGEIAPVRLPWPRAGMFRVSEALRLDDEAAP